MTDVVEGLTRYFGQNWHTLQCGLSATAEPLVIVMLFLFLISVICELLTASHHLMAGCPRTFQHQFYHRTGEEPLVYSRSGCVYKALQHWYGTFTAYR